MGKPVSAHKKPQVAEEDEENVREDYVKRMRDNYPLIVRSLMHDIIVSVDRGGNLDFRSKFEKGGGVLVCPKCGKNSK